MSEKRKAESDDNLPIQKKLKTSIIVDPVALDILKELEVSEEFLNSGQVLVRALSSEDPEYLDILEYVAQGQEHNYGLKILCILGLLSKDENFMAFDDMPEHKGKLRQMLFHGTEEDKVASILEGGLKIPEANWQMFGQGIYFADRASKSANYCKVPHTFSLSQFDSVPVEGSTGYIFLADVLLGKVHEPQQAANDMSAPPQGYDSVKGVGRMVPDSGKSKVVGGCTWPLGSTTDTHGGWSSWWPFGSAPTYLLQFNEYVVYKPEQVQPKYLLKVEFTAKKHVEKSS